MFEYKPDVNYEVEADGDTVLNTINAGRSPVTNAVKGLIGRLLQGRIRKITIRGDDGSSYRITLQKTHSGYA